MSLTSAGCAVVASALLGDGLINLFNNANSALGVGDNTTAFAVGQTVLKAEELAGNHLRKGMNVGYPDRDPEADGSGNLTRYQSTFSTIEGNFSWQEWGIFNNAAASSGTMLMRVVENLGTKTSNAVWVFEVDILVNTGA